MSDFYVSPSMKENPFYYDGMMQDEYLTENRYFSICITNQFKDGVYKTLRKQLGEGLIKKIPEEYKVDCLNPDWDKELYRKT